MNKYAIDQFIARYCSEPRLAFNRIVVVRYRMYLESRHLAANTVKQQLAAVRRLARVSVWQLVEPRAEFVSAEACVGRYDAGQA